MSWYDRRYPHRIRLTDMWQLLPEDASAGVGIRRYKIGPWSTQGLEDYRGPARIRRSFGRPRTIPPDERALLVIGGCDAPTTVVLNGEELAGGCERWSITRFDVTHLLGARNQLELQTSPIEALGPKPRPFGGILWGAELQMWPPVWIDYAFAVVTMLPPNRAEVVCVLAIEGTSAAELTAHAEVYAAGVCLGKSDALRTSPPCQMNLRFEAKMPSGIAENSSPPHIELPWLVGSRSVDPAEIFRVRLRLRMDTGQLIEMELPAGPFVPEAASASFPVSDLLAFMHAPELALSGPPSTGPKAISLRTPPLSVVSLPYLVARLAGHPRLAAWVVTGTGPDTEALAQRLAELDPIRPIRTAG